MKCELFIQFWVIISIISFSLETIPNLSKETAFILIILEWVSVAIFTVEYIVRFYYNNKYPFTFFGLVDLLAILPFYIGIAIDLRSIRVVRLMRTIRLFKLMRYNKSLDRLKNAFIDVKDELIVFFILTSIVIYVSSVGIYYFEHQEQPENFGSIFHSIWWSVCTFTTVGYGDAYPKTLGGRLFTCLVLMVGIGVVSVPSGLIAAALTRNRDS